MTPAKPAASSYQESGVDIAKGNTFVNNIQRSMKSTQSAAVIHQARGFAALFDPSKSNLPQNEELLWVSSTDGVGTKISLALQADNLSHIGQDLAGMVLNDLAVTGAQSLFFLDYLASSKLSLQHLEQIVEGLCKALKKCDTALVGGETAEMPGTYREGEIDVAGFAVGAVSKKKLISPARIAQLKNKGPYKIMGVESSGYHSNGFSLIRHLIKKNNLDIHEKTSLSFHQNSQKEISLADLLLTPTHLYSRLCLKLNSVLNSEELLGIAHITGGGLLENPNRMLPLECPWMLYFDLQNYPLPSAYKQMAELGLLQAEEMLKTFNNGIGLTLLLHADCFEKTAQLVQAEGFKSFDLGRLIEKNQLAELPFEINTGEVAVHGFDLNT